MEQKKIENPSRKIKIAINATEVKTVKNYTMKNNLSRLPER